MKKDKQIVIELKNVSKKYTLHHEKPTFVENIFRRIKKEEFVALKNINIKIFRGEKIGIIGPNGAGKTTLLKIIAGIANPDFGTVKTKGKVISLINLEAGFHPDLTGEENIFLNGLVIGIKKQELKKRFEEIVSFADIGQFIDAPFYTYSRGMKLRLGFSIAVHADPEILLLDEGMFVGDNDFRQKSEKKIQQLIGENKTVIMASHWLNYLKRNCRRFIQVENGQIVKDGGLKVINDYTPALVAHRKY